MNQPTNPPPKPTKRATPTKRTTAKTPKRSPRSEGATASRARKSGGKGGGGNRRGTPPLVQAAVLERRKQAYEMWLIGTDYVTIGRALGRSKKLAQLGPNGEHGYVDVDEHGDPVDDSQLSEVVRQDLIRVRRDRGRMLDETVRAHRQAMVDAHYRMVAALGPAVLRGDPQAHGAAVKHMERIAKLKGLDAPTRVEVGANDPEVAAAVDEIMNAIDAAAAAKERAREAAAERAAAEGVARGEPGVGGQAVE